MPGISRWTCELVSGKLSSTCLRSTSSSVYSKPRLRTKFAERAFSFSGPAKRNCLQPSDLRMITDTTIFKKKLKAYFYKTGIPCTVAYVLLSCIAGLYFVSALYYVCNVCTVDQRSLQQLCLINDIDQHYPALRPAARHCWYGLSHASSSCMQHARPVCGGGYGGFNPRKNVKKISGSVYHLRSFEHSFQR